MVSDAAEAVVQILPDQHGLPHPGQIGPQATHIKRRETLFILRSFFFYVGVINTLKKSLCGQSI